MRMRPHEQVTETEQTKPRVKGTQGTPGRKEGAPRDGKTRGRTGTQAPAQKERHAGARLLGDLERSGQAGRRGGCAGRKPARGRRSAGDRSLEGTWHRLGPPALPGLAEPARLRGPARPAVCPGLPASREGAGSWNRRGGPCAEEGPAWQISSGRCGGPARCQVWAWGLLRERAGAGAQGLGEVAQRVCAGGTQMGEGCLLKLLGSHRLHTPPLHLLPFCSFKHHNSYRLSTRLSLVSSPVPLFVPSSLFLLKSWSHFTLLLFLLTFQSQGHPGSQQQTWIQKVPAHGSPDSMTASPTPACKLYTLSAGEGTWQPCQRPALGAGGARSSRCSH